MHEEHPHIDYDLVVKYLSHEAEEEEIRMLQSWISESEDNKVEYERIKAIWEKTGDYRVAEPADVDPLKAWDKLKFRIDQEKTEAPEIVLEPIDTRKSRSMVYYYSAIAASVLLLIGVFYVFRSEELVPVVVYAENTIVKDVLPDGSEITLNENSRVEYLQKPNQRSVSFSGEAFFAVESDISKPFVIQADNAWVKVTGTSFNLKAVQELDTVELAMETGQAYLINGDGSDSLLVTAGRKGILMKKSGKIKLLETEPANDSYWLTRTLIFKRTALSEVFALLQATFKAEIMVEDTLILDCRLSARYKDASLESILEQIANVFELQVSKSDQGYQITGGGCDQ